jgi:hypothetical protein
MSSMDFSHLGMTVKSLWRQKTLRNTLNFMDWMTFEMRTFANHSRMSIIVSIDSSLSPYHVHVVRMEKNYNISSQMTLVYMKAHKT